MEFILLALGLSVGANAFLAYLLVKARQSLAGARKAPQPTLTAEALLHDLTAAGVSVIRVERLNPADLFLRSPR